MPKKNINETKWIGIIDNHDEYEAFVYLIVNKTNNKKYIGRKFTKKRNRKKISNTSNRRKLIISDSDWKYYKSSSKDLQDDILKNGEESFDFIILEWCKTRISAMYLEVEYQVKNDVLTKKMDTGEYEYYNNNIMSKYFRPKEYGTVEYENKCRKISNSLIESYKSGKIKHPMLGKEHPNKGKKLPQTGHTKNTGKQWYNNGIKNISVKNADLVPNGFIQGLIKNNPDQKTKFIKNYNIKPKYCKACNLNLPYSRRKQSYCSDYCQNSTHSNRMKNKWKNNPTKNPSFLGMVITPFGKFTSYVDAAKRENISTFKLKAKIEKNIDGYYFIPKKEIPNEWLKICL